MAPSVHGDECRRMTDPSTPEMPRALRGHPRLAAYVRESHAIHRRADLGDGRLAALHAWQLLMTNDGELKRQLELPSTGVVRTYRARAFGSVTQEQLESLSEGVTIDGVRYGSIDANLERRTGRNCWIEMALTEGKNREVRNVLAFLGLQVSRLIRISYGPFTVEGMETGDLGEVPREILSQFRRTLK